MSSPQNISLKNSTPSGTSSITLPVSSPTAILTPQTTSSEPLTQEELDLKPWKYIGYRELSKFLASDTDFCNFRRFDILSTRVILALQDELAQIEESLEKIDKTLSDRAAIDVDNGSLRNDSQRDRVDLIWKARQKLEEYHRYVYFYVKLKKHAAPTKRDIESLQNWLYNHDGAIDREECEYIGKDDLFALVPKDRSPLRSLLERSSRFRLLSLWKERRGPSSGSELPLHVQQHVHYSSDKRIDHFVTFTTVAIGLIMILAPIWGLAYTDRLPFKLVIITVFIILFVALVSQGTNAKTYESLAATAAYAAILMVFLQMGGSDSD